MIREAPDLKQSVCHDKQDNVWIDDLFRTDSKLMRSTAYAGDPPAAAPAGADSNPLIRFLDDIFAPKPPSEDIKAQATYDFIIDLAAESIYDPKALGNVNALKHKFDGKLHSVDAAIKSAAEALKEAHDPYTKVMTKEEASRFKQELKGYYVGIGIKVQPETFKDGDSLETVRGPLKVNKVLKGTGAEKAGIKPGDIITKIDDKDIHNMKCIDAANLLAGQAGTSVKLTIMRDGKPIDISVGRTPIETPSVEDKDLGNGIAYIKVNDFIADAMPQSMYKALFKHQDAKGFVIDLRDNPGGIVKNALATSSMFISSGNITTSVHRVLSDPEHPLYNTEKYYLTPWFGLDVSFNTDSWLPTSLDIHGREPLLVGNKPVIILVNGHTASASEMFTGAVHDQSGATVVGTRTYGKGIGQSIMPLPGGAALKVTSLRYYTPNGAWLGDANKTRIGIKPDVVVPDPPAAEKGSDTDAQLKKAVELIQKGRAN